MKSSPRSLILLGLWGFLLGWIYFAINKYQNEDTVFNHFNEANSFQWPVVNICPMYLYPPRNVSSTTFEEMEKEIKQTMMSYIRVDMFPKGVTRDNPE
mgnify:FL=1